MNLNDIKKIIEAQAKAWENVSVSDYLSRQTLREAIEDDFLSENDITSRQNEFDNDVDYQEVCELRAQAMHDMLEKLGVENADDFLEATDGLAFSHFCGGVCEGNTHLKAYLIDDKTYRIILFNTDDYERTQPGVHSLDIPIDEYNKLPGTDYRDLTRFRAVKFLFNDVY